MRRCFKIPNDVFDQLSTALGPKWTYADAQYTALGIEHLAPHYDGDCFVPLRATLPPDVIEVRPLAPERVAAIIVPYLSSLPAYRQASRAAMLPPVFRQVVEGSFPIVVDDPTARTWRFCQSCLRLFHTQHGRPTQRYCDNACGNLAYAWQTWAHNCARYPTMLPSSTVDVWGAQTVRADTRPRPSTYAIPWFRRPGGWWTWRTGTQRRLLHQYIGRRGYPLNEMPPRWQWWARWWKQGMASVRTVRRVLWRRG